MHAVKVREIAALIGMMIEAWFFCLGAMTMIVWCV